MRLALTISSLSAGGAERVLTNLANAWAEKGHDVSLITLSEPQTPPFYALDPRIQLMQINQTAAENLPLLSRLRNIIRRIIALRRTLKALKPDIIISFVDIINMTTLLSSRGLKIPVIVSERTDPAYHNLPSLYQKLRRICYPWADKIISQTQSASDYFSEIPKEKKGIIPNSVPKPFLYKEDASKPLRHIVSVGRLCPNKGFDTLIKAFSRLAPSDPALRLTIYGEGVARHALEALIQRLHLTDRVNLPGTTQNIPAILREADLFVFPSRYEGFPNALCEAMAVGLPIIASACSGTVDIVRDGIDGRLFPIDDEKALEKLLQELLHDPAQRVRLSQEARTVSDRFSETAILQLWEDLLQDLASFLTKKMFI